MIDFSTVTQVLIPEGEAVQIEIGGVVVWVKDMERGLSARDAADRENTRGVTEE